MRRVSPQTAETTTVGFDPFGEPVTAGSIVPLAHAPTRRAFVAAFWIAAIALVGGRIYLGEAGLPRTAAVAPAASVQMVALP